MTTPGTIVVRENGVTVTVSDKWWHCGFCGDHAKAEDPYQLGDKEPCTHCGEGTAKVMTLKEGARLESEIAQGLVKRADYRSYSEVNMREV